MKKRTMVKLFALIITILLFVSPSLAEQGQKSYHYSGAGTTILKDFPSLSDLAYRYIFSWEKPGDVHLFYNDLGFNWDVVKIHSTDNVSSVQFLPPMNDSGKFYVECQSPWKLLIQPVSTVSECSFSGTGNCVTDLFPLVDDRIINVQIKPGSSTSFQLCAYQYCASVYQAFDTLCDGYVTDDVSSQFIVSPQNLATHALFTISCDQDCSWTVSAAE